MAGFEIKAPTNLKVCRHVVNNRKASTNLKACSEVSYCVTYLANASGATLPPLTTTTILPSA